jgi:hypothetical protein
VFWEGTSEEESRKDAMSAKKNTKENPKDMLPYLFRSAVNTPFGRGLARTS